MWFSKHSNGEVVCEKTRGKRVIKRVVSTYPEAVVFFGGKLPKKV